MRAVVAPHPLDRPPCIRGRSLIARVGPGLGMEWTARDRPSCNVPQDGVVNNFRCLRAARSCRPRVFWSIESDHATITATGPGPEARGVPVPRGRLMRAEGVAVMAWP